MSQLVKLQYRVVQILELKVSGDRVGVGVVRRMLHGAEVVYLVFLRNDNYAARVLTRSPLDADAAAYKALHLGAAHGYALALKILCNVAECGLIGKSADGAGAESVTLTEKRFGVFVYIALNVAGEVKVYIRHLIAVESQKSLKGNIVTVAVHVGLAADGAVLWLKVKSGFDAAVRYKLGVLALQAAVVRGQGVYFCDSRHHRGKG